MVMFPVCGHRKRADLVKFVKENNNVPDDRKCYTCNSVLNAPEDITNQNKSTKDHLVATRNVRKHQWSKNTFLVDMDGLFNKSEIISNEV